MLSVRLLRASLRSHLPGSYRFANWLGRSYAPLHCAPITLFDSVVYLDFRMPASFDLLEHPDRELPERRMMRSLVQPHHVVFDVGANIGLHTASISRLVEKVYAFEPNPLLHPQLSETCKRLGNVELMPLALSDSSGEVLLFAPLDHTMASLRRWTNTRVSALRCKTARLDDLNLRYRISSNVTLRWRS